MLSRVISCYYMICSVVTSCQELLHVVQCCYTWNCVVEFRAAVFYVVMCSCMLCSVVTCYQELLHVVQCCYMLLVTKSYYMRCSVVRCYQELLHVVQCGCM